MTDPDVLARLDQRQQRLWGLHDFSGGRGLEIGPLHKLTVARDLADVAYLDVFDRATLLVNYRDHPNVVTERIPEIDYALHDGDRVRTIPETIGDSARFDWVMASHVIEHVPDLIGWLDQVAQVTVDGGALILVVPDRRYCFDIHRPGTTVGQLLHAHELGAVTPSVRAVYDHYRSHVFTDTAQAWSGKPPDYAMRSRSLETVMSYLEQARNGDYVDAHVWAFTPNSFHEQLIELRDLGESVWAVETLEPTRKNQLEFVAVLRRLPRDRTRWSMALNDELKPTFMMPDWLDESVRLKSSLVRKNRRLHRLRRRNRLLERKLNELDRSWLSRARGKLRRKTGEPQSVD